MYFRSLPPLPRQWGVVRQSDLRLSNPIERLFSESGHAATLLRAMPACQQPRRALRQLHNDSGSDLEHERIPGKKRHSKLHLSRATDRSAIMRRLFSFLLIATLLSSAGVAGAQGQPSAHHPPPQGPNFPPKDLANALVQMARAAHLPLIAELVWPLPTIPTAEGVPLTPDRLNDLVKQSPGYEWKMEGKAVHFYNKKLRDAQFNFLNLKFRRFAVLPDLSQLILWLPVEAKGLLEGYSGVGGATSGWGNSELEKEKLQPDTLENVTPLEVLIRVANESPTFYTVLVFPSIAPTKNEADKQVAWQWGSLNEKLRAVDMQPSPAKPR